MKDQNGIEVNGKLIGIVQPLDKYCVKKILLMNGIKGDLRCQKNGGNYIKYIILNHVNMEKKIHLKI